MPPPPPARDRFAELLRTCVAAQDFVKLTLGKPRGRDPSLRNVFVRPVQLKAGPRLSFVWRHDTRDVTKNLLPNEGVSEIERLLTTDFLDAHLFTTRQTVQFEGAHDGPGRLSLKDAPSAAPSETNHDRVRQHPLAHDSSWLRALGVTNERGQPREGMAGKLRQIQKFTEVIGHLVDDAGLRDRAELTVVDMGCGKGYLTFALAALLGARASVSGVENRPHLTEQCNQVARAARFERLSFVTGDIATTEIGQVNILVALHACDTATDDALAKGIAAGADLLVVSPCCQKELRPQLKAPPVLADALRHGIFQERQAEFVTDALRAQLLEWAGYHTKVFEFVSTEHTAKNVMIAALKHHPPGDGHRAGRLRDFARFYGIQQHRLARHLGVSLA